MMASWPPSPFRTIRRRHRRRRLRRLRAVVDVAAGVDMQRLVLRTCKQGLAGIECLADTVETHLDMNALLRLLGIAPAHAELAR